MKKLFAIIISLCLIISCFALLGVSLNYTPKVSIEEFSAELSEMNRKYKDEPVGNRLIVKSKRDIAALDSVDVVEGYEDLHIVQFDNSESAEEALDYYNDSKTVEYAEQDFTMSTCEIDYKPHLSWGSESMGTDDYFAYFEDVDNLPEIVVGVIDTGIELDHEFLRDRIIQTGVNYSESGTEGSENDDNGHGTHCAGIIVDNTLDNVKIEGFKVLSDKGSGSMSNVISGIYSAIENDVDIISMSLGGKGRSDAMQDAVNVALSKGITVCAGAGNDGTKAENFCPANLDGVIAVAAHDAYDNMPMWSNFGDTVDIIAPGVAIESSWLGNTYETHSGTSMACPHAAAAAALILSKHNNYSATDILNVFQSNGRNVENQFYEGKKILYIGDINNYRERTVMPEFITKPDIYEEQVDIELACNDENADIYYTIDGTIPTLENSTLYTEPIHIDNSSVIKAFAYNRSKIKSILLMGEFFIATADSDDNYEIDENGVITAYNGSSKYLKIPETIKGITVTGIGYRVFYSSEIYKVILPKTLKTIGEDAFRGCNNIKSIDLSYVESVGKMAFYSCKGLVSVKTETDISLTDGSFRACDLLSDFDISNVTRLGKETFYNCISLYGGYNDKIETIPAKAFRNCKAALYFEFVNLKHIDEYSFKSCSKLEIFKAPNLYSINTYGMNDLCALKNLSFPNLTVLNGTSHFALCRDLEYVYLPKISGKLPKSCFYWAGISSDQRLNIRLDNISEIDEMAFEGAYINYAVFKNVEKVGEEVFKNSKINTLYLPKTISTGSSAFQSSKINNLFLPSLVSADWLPIHIESITIFVSEKFVNSASINSVSNNFTIIAPKGLYAEAFSKDCCENATFIDSNSIIKYIASYQINGKRHYDFCLDGIGEILSVADNIECGFICDGEELEAEAGNRNGDSLYLSFSSSENISSLRAKINIDGMVFMSPELTEFDNVKAVDVLPENDCGHNWELIYFADGISVFTCAECNESYYVSFISQLRHNDNLIDMNSDGKVNGKDYHYLMRDYSAYSVSV